MKSNNPNFKDQNCKMDKLDKACSSSNQPNKCNNFKKPEQPAEKANVHPNKFNNFKK